jgi:hypothetical protein
MYRSSNNEALVADEILQRIASTKRKRITAIDLGELIKQQQVRSPHLKIIIVIPSVGCSRLAKPCNTASVNFQKTATLLHAGQFMKSWEDFDLSLNGEGPYYHGNYFVVLDFWRVA